MQRGWESSIRAGAGTRGSAGEDSARTARSSYAKRMQQPTPEQMRERQAADEAEKEKAHQAHMKELAEQRALQVKKEEEEEQAFLLQQQNNASGVDVVKVDGLVLLKIIKHCQEALPELCSGSLLGLDIDTKLEVTNCFPFPTDGDEEDEEELGGEAYQQEMMKLLREVQVDNNSVGWYRSTYMGSFCTSDLVEQQYNYQETLDQGTSKSVVLVYDPFQSSKGKLVLKAYRISESFMKMYRERKAKNPKANADDIDSQEILEEIPIEVTNSQLANVLLQDIEEKQGSKVDVDLDRLDLSTNPYLEKNLEFMVEEIDNLAAEQQNIRNYYRDLQKQKQAQERWLLQRRAENSARMERGDPLLPEEDPTNPIFKKISNQSKIESLLIRNQIGVYCDQVNKFSGVSLSKLYVAGAFQE